MKERTRNTIVGITTLAGLAALVWLIFVFGEMPMWMADNYKIRIAMDDANGLAAGSRIKLNGIDIGFIESVRFQDNPADGVVITGLIESRYRVPANATAIASASLLGGAGQLSIRPDDPDPGVPPAAVAQYLPTDGTGRLTGRATSMSRQIEAITQSIGADLRVQLENFGRVSEAVVTLAEQYTLIGKRLNQMLEERSVADVDAGRASANISTIVTRVDSALAQMRSAAAQINELVSDEQLQEDLRQTLRNARGLTADAREIAGNAGQQIDRLTRAYIAAADDLSETMHNLNALLVDARTGEGTMARLIQDPALYESLTDTAQRFSEAIREAKLLLQKWKAEGLPVQF